MNKEKNGFYKNILKRVKEVEKESEKKQKDYIENIEKRVDKMIKEEESSSHMDYILKYHEGLTESYETDELFYQMFIKPREEEEKKEKEIKAKKEEETLLKELMTAKYPTEVINNTNREVLYRLFEADKNGQLNIKKREEINVFKLLKEIYLKEKRIADF